MTHVSRECYHVYHAIFEKRSNHQENRFRYVLFLTSYRHERIVPVSFVMSIFDKHIKNVHRIYPEHALMHVLIMLLDAQISGNCGLVCNLHVLFCNCSRVIYT